MAIPQATIKSKAINVNYEKFTGDTLWLRFDYRTAAKPLGTQIDLTGCTFRLHVKASLDDVLPLVAKTNTDFTVGDSDCNIKVKLTSTDLTTLGPGVFIYDVEITNSLGEPDTFAYGKIKLTQSGTR